MSIAALIATLEERGVDAATILAAVKAVAVDAAPARSSAAERQARYRANKAETVTRDVTRDVTPPSSPLVPPSLSPTPPYSPPYNPPPTPSLSGPASPDTDRAPFKASSKGKAGYTPEFELVWSEWPKSPTESKKLAFDRFARLSKPDRDACFDGAMAQTMWLEAETERRKGRDPPPRLHLSTFISERRWENLLNTEFNRYGRTPWPTTQAQR
jgi:hypothetical protein